MGLGGREDKVYGKGSGRWNGCEGKRLGERVGDGVGVEGGAGRWEGMWEERVRLEECGWRGLEDLMDVKVVCRGESVRFEGYVECEVGGVCGGERKRRRKR